MKTSTGHPHARTASRRRLRAALILTVSVLVVEVAGGLLSGSLALLADAAHMFTDVAALILAYAAMTLADRGPTKRYTFGLYRAEILAAFINAQLLLVICGVLLYQAYVRFASSPPIETGTMLSIAVVGLAANLIAVTLLRDHHRHSLNLRAAYLEVVTDAATSAAVIVAAIIMAWTSWFWLDPVLSAAIGVFIVPRTLSILKQAGHILLEGTPSGINLGRLRQRLLEVPGVDELHDLHLWTLTSGLHSASVHVCASKDSEPREVLLAVQHVLKEDIGVDHATVQVEQGGETACRTSLDHG